MQKILKKYNVYHYSTYSMKASIIERSIVETIQKRYVEDVYTQWQLQVDRRAAASHVGLRRISIAPLACDAHSRGR